MTVLEVLVSLAIFALAAIGLSAAYVNTLDALRAAAEAERDAGDWRAIRAILLNEPNPRKVEHGGRLRLSDDREITWEVKLSPEDVLDLFEVTLTGRVMEGQRSGQVHQETFRVLRPTWSQADERISRLDQAKVRRHREEGR